MSNKGFDQIKIGKYLARKRKEKGLTQVQVADAFFVTDRTVSRWENGMNLPDKEIIPQLCDLLGITIDELFTGEDKPSAVPIDKKQKQHQSFFIPLGAVVVITILIVSILFYRNAQYYSRFTKYTKSTTRHQIESEIGRPESHFDELSYCSYKHGNEEVYLYFNGTETSSNLMAIIVRNRITTKDRIILPFLDGIYTFVGDDNCTIEFKNGSYTINQNSTLNLKVPDDGTCHFEIKEIIHEDNGVRYFVRLNDRNSSVAISFKTDKDITIIDDTVEYLFRK